MGFTHQERAANFILSHSTRTPDPEQASAEADRLPVNRIVPEVLTEILKFRESGRDLLSATHVCRSWRSALVSAPHLWTRIPCNNTYQTSAYLGRSRSVPIDVVAKKVDSVPLSDAALNLIVPHLRRVKSMRIFFGGQPLPAFFKFCRPAPLLQELIISGSLKHCNLPPGFLGSSFPSLRTLVWRDDSYSEMPLIPLGLLIFAYFGPGASSSLRDLLGIISSAPLLDQLQITNMDGDIIPDPSPAHEIHLGSLRNLNLVSGSALSRVLPQLKVPQLRTLNLLLPAGVGASTIADLLPSDSYPLLTEVTSMNFRIMESDSMMELSGGGVEVSVTKRTRMDSFFSTTSFPFAQITRLRLYATAEPIVEMIDEFTNLKHLDLSLCYEDAEVFSALSPSPGPGSSVPCPHLVTMEVTFSETHAVGAFKRMVRSRKEVGKPLTSVNVTDAGHIDDIEGMLDTNEVNEWLIGALVLQ